MGEPSTLAPVVKKVVVPLDRAEAFELFTAKIHTWWPLDKGHSISEDHAASCAIEGRVGGRIFEVDNEGGEHLWGTVESWDPPSALSFTWHPGREASTAQHVEVSFESGNAETSVELRHWGWEVAGDRAEEMRSSYDTGWGFTLGRFVDRATQRDPEGRA
jgi:uncharacterized protein YndB with AHSA1/START domain